MFSLDSRVALWTLVAGFNLMLQCRTSRAVVKKKNGGTLRKGFRQRCIAVDLRRERGLSWPRSHEAHALQLAANGRPRASGKARIQNAIPVSALVQVQKRLFLFPSPFGVGRVAGHHSGGDGRRRSSRLRDGGRSDRNERLLPRYGAAHGITPRPEVHGWISGIQANFFLRVQTSESRKRFR